MRYLFFLSLTLLFLSCNSDKKFKTVHPVKTHILKGNVQLENGTGNFGIEVFALPDGDKNREKEETIASAKVGADGNYTLKLPDSVKKYQIHFTAPNYVTYYKTFVTRDPAPELNVTLRPNAIGKDFDTLRVYGDFNDFSWDTMLDMTKIDSNHYEITIDYDKPEMKYQIKFNTEHHTYPNIVKGAQYEYDFGGDHQTIVKSDNGKYHIVVDLNNFVLIDNPNDRPESEGEYKNAPVNEIYGTLVKKLGSRLLSRLSQYFYIVVKRENEDYVKGWSEEDIQKTVDWTWKNYNQANKFADSLLETTKTPFIQDFVLAAKIKLMFMSDSADYDEAWALFEQIKSIPAEHNDVFNNFIHQEGFYKNSDKILTGIEAKINSIRDENEKIDMLYNYYYALKYKINDTNKLKEKVIAGFEKLKTMDIRQEWMKESVVNIIAGIKLKTETKAPNFEFTMLDARQSELKLFKGNWVLLHFWSINCGFCVQEIPYLVEAYNKYKDKNFFIVSIADCPDLKGTVNFIDEHKMDWFNTVTVEGYAKEAKNLYGINGVPTLFLINPDGDIVRGDDVNLRGSSLMKTLDKYVGGQEL